MKVYIQNCSYKNGMEFLDYVEFNVQGNFNSTQKHKKLRLAEVKSMREYLQKKFYPETVQEEPKPKKRKTKKYKPKQSIQKNDESTVKTNRKEKPTKPRKLKLKPKISVRDMVKKEESGFDKFFK